jgi:hypothetical protein
MAEEVVLHRECLVAWAMGFGGPQKVAWHDATLLRPERQGPLAGTSTLLSELLQRRLLRTFTNQYAS